MKHYDPDEIEKEQRTSVESRVRELEHRMRELEKDIVIINRRLSNDKSRVRYP